MESATRRKSLNVSIAGLLAALIVVPAGAQVNLPAANALPVASADASKPGFLWNVFQNEANQDNSNTRTELALSGLLVDGDGNPLPNLADPAAQGPASGPGTKLGTADNSVIQF